MLGERFGSFKTVARLGAGSMGEVFLAEHQRIERRAAIKVLMPERSQDAETVRRFFIEARATSLIHHPGIIQIYDCDVHRNGRAYIVMEHLEGETLAGRLGRLGRLSWESSCRIAHLVADALGAAHDKGIIHRDLKPENVFLLSDQEWLEPAQVKVLDFGVAKLVGGDLSGAAATAAGSLLGSPAYMSPEQCSGARVDARSDVYSLGCVLFEMISGSPPFPSKRVRDLLASHKLRKPPSLSSQAPQIPRWLERTVSRMLSKDPEHRPQAMAEVARALGAADHQEPQEAPSPEGGPPDRAGSPTQTRP